MNPNTQEQIDQIPVCDQVSDGFSIEDIRQGIQEALFDINTPPTPLVPRLLVNSIPVSHVGGVTAILGGCKRGKSNYGMNGQAAALNCGGDCLGWSSDGNPDRHAVIHMDTEQSRQQCDTMIRRRFTASQFVPPEWYKSVSVGHWGIDMLFAGLEVLVSDAYRDFGGIHSIWLDGCSDFLKSVNDEARAMELVKNLSQMAREYSCAIVVSLHVTQGDNGLVNGRGHLGRELERKAETVLLLSGSGSITKVSTLRSRNKPVRGDDCIYFEYSEVVGRHVTVNPSQDEELKHYPFLLECWRGRDDAAFTLAEIYRNSPSYKESNTTKRNWINILHKEKLVDREPEGFKRYQLTLSGRELMNELIEGETLVNDYINV